MPNTIYQMRDVKKMPGGKILSVKFRSIVFCIFDVVFFKAFLKARVVCLFLPREPARKFHQNIYRGWAVTAVAAL